MNDQPCLDNIYKEIEPLNRTRVQLCRDTE